MKVLSLFDGASGGRLALDRLGVEPEVYYASEIDTYAIKIAQKNYPDTIQLGSVTDHKQWDLGGIDLMVGGSPCQDLSRIKSKDGQGLQGEKSKLFFEYLKSLYKFKPKYFMLENVLMNEESHEIITAALGVKPVEINSGHFSAQDRRRLYWTNLPVDMNLPDNRTVFKDIMEHNVDEKYFYPDEFGIFNGMEKRVVGSLHRYYPNGKVKFTETTSRVYNPNFKMATLTAVSGGHQEKKIYVDGRVRKLTPLEYERLQTIPDGYTEGVSNSQRYKMLGNGWTTEAIVHVLQGIKEERKVLV